MTLQLVNGFDTKEDRRMMDSFLDVCLHDPEGFLPHVTDALLLEPYPIIPLIDFPTIETEFPRIRIRFCDEDCTTANFHIYLLGYYPNFRPATLTTIRCFGRAHPDECFLAVIFNFQPKSWKSFAANRSKVEQEFEALGIDAPVCVLKYSVKDDRKVPEAELTLLQTKVTNYMAFNIQRHITRASNNVRDNVDRLTNTYRLFWLLFRLGFCNEAVCYFNQLNFEAGVHFWPESPLFYDIQEDLPFDPSSGFTILCTSLSFVYRKALQNSDWSTFCELLTRSFAIILEYSATESTAFFARHWIQSAAQKLADKMQVMAMDDFLCGSFSMISMQQLLHLSAAKSEVSDHFVSHVPAARHDSFDAAFCLECNRVRRCHQTGYEYARSYASTRLFQYMASLDDRDGARGVLDVQHVKLDGQAPLRSLFETEVAVALFEWDPSESNAETVLASRAHSSVKLSALGLLGVVFPRTSIRPILHAPGLGRPVRLFGEVSIGFEFDAPPFLIGESVRLKLRFLGSSSPAKSPSIQMVLDQPRMVVRTSFVCRAPGTYERLFLSIKFGKSDLRWRLPNRFPLVVAEYQNLPSIEFNYPCHLSQTGETQAASFRIRDIDPEYARVSMSFKSDALIAIFFGGTEYGPDAVFELTEFESSLIFELRLRFDRGDQLVFNFIYAFRNGTGDDVSQSFDFLRRPIQVTMHERTARFQRIQIINPFAVKLSFDNDGKTHIIHPFQTYYLFRNVSEEPLTLVLKEEGWEEFPVVLTFHFHEQQAVAIDLDWEGWEVGEARIATLPQPAFVIGDPQGVWIVEPVDVKGLSFVMIPKVPGRLTPPEFITESQVVNCRIDSIFVLPLDMSKFNRL
jgi:hypothetical protein